MYTHHTHTHIYIYIHAYRKVIPLAIEITKSDRKRSSGTDSGPKSFRKDDDNDSVLNECDSFGEGRWLPRRGVRSVYPFTGVVSSTCPLTRM